MYNKSIAFNDIETATKIMDTHEAVQQKTSGKRIKNFSINIWKEKRCEAMNQVVRAKFLQNEN